MQVGYKAVDDHVKSGMVVGLGTGSTAAYAVDRVGELIKVRRCEVEHIRFTPRVEHRVLNTAC